MRMKWPPELVLGLVVVGVLGALWALFSEVGTWQDPGDYGHADTLSNIPMIVLTLGGVYCVLAVLGIVPFPSSR
jgi:hypothetical protein